MSQELRSLRWFALGLAIVAGCMAACGSQTVTIDTIPTRATLPDSVKYYHIPIEANDWDELCVARRLEEDPFMGFSCLPMKEVRVWAHGRLKAN